MGGGGALVGERPLRGLQAIRRAAAGRGEIGESAMGCGVAGEEVLLVDKASLRGEMASKTAISAEARGEKGFSGLRVGGSLRKRETRGRGRRGGADGLARGVRADATFRLVIYSLSLSRPRSFTPLPASRLLSRPLLSLAWGVQPTGMGGIDQTI